MPVNLDAITAVGLRKAYREHIVLDGIDLHVPHGTIYALLGPNGAGKTTIVHILSTLLPADAGQVLVAGCDLHRDPDGIRAAIGLTGQFSAVDGLLTGEENLWLMADLRRLGRSNGRRRASELLAAFDLVEAARKLAAAYSGGMRRRLDLAMTLVGDPQVIFLDEPTTGLDPRSRRTMWQIVRDLVAGGVTILLTTQYLDEADELADRVGVLDHGRLVGEGTPAELKRRVAGGHVRLRFPDRAARGAATSTVGGTCAGTEDEFTLDVPYDGEPQTIGSILDRLRHAAVPVNELTLHTPDLDDVFLALTGQPRPDTQEVLTP